MTRQYLRAEVAKMLGVEESFLVLLEAEEIVIARDDAYAAADLERIRFSHTLMHELDVNLPGIVVALQLMKRLEEERVRFEETLEALQRGLEHVRHNPEE